MEIRSATPGDDFMAIGNIYAAAWRAAYRGVIPDSYLDGLRGELWASRRLDEQFPPFVALDGSRYAGVCSFGPARDEEMEGWGEVVSLYLLPEYWGGGHAGPLLESALAALARMDFRRVYLWVLEENRRARRFYQKQGFAPNGDALSIEIGGVNLTELRYKKRLK